GLVLHCLLARAHSQIEGDHGSTPSRSGCVEPGPQTLATPMREPDANSGIDQPNRLALDSHLVDFQWLRTAQLSKSQGCEIAPEPRRKPPRDAGERRPKRGGATPHLTRVTYC